MLGGLLTAGADAAGGFNNRAASGAGGHPSGVQSLAGRNPQRGDMRMLQTGTLQCLNLKDGLYRRREDANSLDETSDSELQNQFAAESAKRGPSYGVQSFGRK